MKIISHKKFFVLLFLIMAILGILFGGICFGRENQDKSKENEKRTAELSTFDINIKEPKVNAKGAMVYCEEKGQTLYGKNIGKALDPLSITKLMTVYITMKSIDDGKFTLDTDFITSSEDMKVEENKLFLKKGEKMKVRYLIHGTLIESDNDAAAVLGTNISGNKAKFAKLMNETARELGCTNTKFANANGLIENGCHSSAHDLILIARACFKYEFVREVCQKKKFTIPPTKMTKTKRIVKSTNPFFEKKNSKKKPYKEYNILAGKTGTWEYNNAALLELSEYKGNHIYTVVLNDYMDDRYKDTKKLIMYARKVIDAQSEIEKQEKIRFEKLKNKNNKEKNLTKNFLSKIPIHSKIISFINDIGRTTTANIISSNYSKTEGVTIKWQPVKGASSYNIYRWDSDGNGKYELIRHGEKKNKLIDKNIKSNKIYSYYVQADYGSIPEFFIKGWSLK